MKRFLFFVVVIASMLVLVPSATATPESRMLQLINDWRSDHGLHKVRSQDGLTAAARVWTKRILDADSLSHGDIGRRLARYYPSKGYRYWSVGEVVGYTSAYSPRAMLRLWLKSTPHRAIIAKRRWRDIGIDMMVGEYKGSWVWMWVVDWGRRY